MSESDQRKKKYFRFRSNSKERLVLVNYFTLLSSFYFWRIYLNAQTRYFVSGPEWHPARCWGRRCRMEGDAQRTGAGGGRGPRRRRRRVLGGVRRGRPRYRRKAGWSRAHRRRSSRGRTGYRDRRRFRRSVARNICPCVGIVQVQGTVKYIAITLDSPGWWLVGVTLVVAFGFLPQNFGRWWGLIPGCIDYKSFARKWMQSMVVGTVNPYLLFKKNSNFLHSQAVGMQALVWALALALTNHLVKLSVTNI